MHASKGAALILKQLSLARSFAVPQVRYVPNFRHVPRRLAGGGGAARQERAEIVRHDLGKPRHAACMISSQVEEARIDSDK